MEIVPYRLSCRLCAYVGPNSDSLKAHEMVCHRLAGLSQEISLECMLDLGLSRSLPRISVFSCSKPGCTFLGTYEEVKKHEAVCRRLLPLLMPAPSSNADEEIVLEAIDPCFECDTPGCTFKGSYQESIKHEKVCKRLLPHDKVHELDFEESFVMTDTLVQCTTPGCSFKGSYHDTMKHQKVCRRLEHLVVYAHDENTLLRFGLDLDEIANTSKEEVFDISGLVPGLSVAPERTRTTKKTIASIPEEDDDEISILTTENARLKAELAQAKQLHALSLEDTHELCGELESTTATVEELHRVHEEKRELEACLAEKRKELDKVLTEVERLRRSSITMQSDMQQLEASVYVGASKKVVELEEQLKSQRKTYEAKLITVDAQLKKLRHESKQKHPQENDAHARRIRALRVEARERRKVVADWELSITKCTHLEEELKREQAYSRYLLHENELTQKKNDQLRLHADQLMSEHDHLIQELEDTATAIEVLDAQLETSQNDRGEIAAALGRLEMKYKTLKVKYDQIQQDRGDLGLALSRSQSESDTLQAEIDVLQKQISSMSTLPSSPQEDSKTQADDDSDDDSTKMIQLAAGDDDEYGMNSSPDSEEDDVLYQHEHEHPISSTKRSRFHSKKKQRIRLGHGHHYKIKKSSPVTESTAAQQHSFDSSDDDEVAGRHTVKHQGELTLSSLEENTNGGAAATIKEESTTKELSCATELTEKMLQSALYEAAAIVGKRFNNGNTAADEWNAVAGQLAACLDKHKHIFQSELKSKCSVQDAATNTYEQHRSTQPILTASPRTRRAASPKAQSSSPEIREVFSEAISSLHFSPAPNAPSAALSPENITPRATAAKKISFSPEARRTSAATNGSKKTTDFYARRASTGSFSTVTFSSPFSDTSQHHDAKSVRNIDSSARAHRRTHANKRFSELDELSDTSSSPTKSMPSWLRRPPRSREDALADLSELRFQADYQSFIGTLDRYSDHEFYSLFQMTRTEFKALPVWKKYQQLKTDPSPSRHGMTS